ncbi:MAG: HAD family hydrolase, partial [Ruminococcaceae bacterium]|nr:HAD family hydrolase [Oscillospiraceae bacterium]
MDNVSETISGLSTAEVRQRRLQGQSNGCFEIKTKSVARIIGDNVFTLFNLINVLLAVFVLLTGSYRNMLFMGVVVSNTAIGVIQEIRSKRVIDRLSLISAPKAHLIRDGIECSAAVSDIVVDDIMLLSTGRQICVDAVVVSGDCEVDESLITGESDPVVKSVGCELLSGSFVVSGAAKARVIRVGAESYANKITSGAKYMKKQTSDMMNSINKIINTVAVCIVPFALLLFFKAIFVIKQEFGHGIVSTVAVLIGMIPEGLVLLTSVALAVSSVRLAKRQILCQDLFCIENLARVDILCLDKTGTLTEGCMDVVEVVKLDEDYNAERALAVLSSVMTDVNPTLAAIKTRYGSDKTEVCTSVIPFSSARKWSAAVTEEHGALILGAPQFVLSGSAYSCVQPIVEKYAGSGLRVLLLASSESAPENCTLPADISPKALVLLSDRVRQTAPQTMEYFRKQGVALKVISGDDPVTAASVAKRAGLMSADRYIDASALSDEELCD